MLDTIDRRLIEELVAEPRATHRRLAQAVDASEGTVAARLRTLVERDLLATTIAFDWRAAGYQRSVYFWLRVSDRPAAVVAAELADLPYARNISSVHGEANLFVHLLLPGGDEALPAARRAIGGAANATVVRQDIVLEHFAHSVNIVSLPVGEAAVPDLPDPVVAIDDLDRQLCEQLATDGRRSNRAIARAIGTTEATLRARLKRLESSGLMRIVTVVDPSVLPSFAASAFVAVRGVSDPGHVASKLAQQPYVRSVTTTSGRFDLHMIAGAESTAELTARLDEDIPAAPGVTTDVHLLGRPYVFSARLRRLL